jgi:hypothetical protein
MENAQGTPMPESTIAAFEYKAHGFTIPFVVASHRHRNGTRRACFVWHRQHDLHLRPQLLFAGRMSRFKVIGAHRDLGHLFPIFFLPFAIAKMVKPATRRLQREISGQTLEAANDNA